jgi:lincosamide nucleotidyltransferase A/C/D/E
MMSAECVLAALARLEAAGLFVSVDGGWGVDALLGEQTRPHDDLDLVIAFDEWRAVCDALRPLGYLEHVDEMPTRFVLRAEGDRRIDFHPMHFDETGYAHQQLPGGKLFTCRIDALNGRGGIDETPVRCLTPELQLAAHLGYESDEIDRQDVRLLCDRFGLSLPQPYR